MRPPEYGKMIIKHRFLLQKGESGVFDIAENGERKRSCRAAGAKTKITGSKSPRRGPRCAASPGDLVFLVSIFISSFR
jgi:hypothetical protein